MKALIVVDMQNDFMPDGPLPVPEADLLAPSINRIMPNFPLVVATQDWHPRNHGSLAVNHSDKQPGDVIKLEGLEQILWPVHCVQNTRGADFVAGLDRDRVDEIFQKGQDPKIDSYSAFFDNGHRKATGLGDFLKGKDVQEVTIAGVATDYCVKFTALDAVELGFKTVLAEDLCRGVDLKPGDLAKAIQQMRDAGVQIAQSGDLQ